MLWEQKKFGDLSSHFCKAKNSIIYSLCNVFDNALPHISCCQLVKKKITGIEIYNSFSDHLKPYNIICMLN